MKKKDPDDDTDSLDFGPVGVDELSDDDDDDETAKKVLSPAERAQIVQGQGSTTPGIAQASASASNPVVPRPTSTSALAQPVGKSAGKSNDLIDLSFHFFDSIRQRVNFMILLFII